MILPDFLKNKPDSSCIIKYIITDSTSIIILKRFGEEYKELWITEDLLTGKGKPKYCKEGNL